MNLSLGTAPHCLVGDDRRHFELIAEIARQDAGLFIAPEKAPMVFARLAKRLRSLGLKKREDYCALVSSVDGLKERRCLISALTTNVTGFFREAHHFDLIAEILRTDIIERARKGEPIRMWSAGCSNGSEPYSMAMQILDTFPESTGLDVRILATDIDPEILAVARAGTYEPERFASVPERLRSKFTRAFHTSHVTPPMREVTPEVRRMVCFRELNLLADWPMRRQFDIIFCRNVVIYFDRQTQDALWPRFERACKPGGHLCLGHSERLPQHHLGSFLPVGKTSYRRLPEVPDRNTSRKD